MAEAEVKLSSQSNSPWASLREAQKLTGETKLSKPIPYWTRARAQMLAVKESEKRRAQAEDERRKKRDAEHLAMRKEHEDMTRRSRMTETDASLDNDGGFESRKKMNERLETMGSKTTVSEEVWDVFG